MTHPLIYTAYGFAADRRFVREPIASFFNSSDAGTFAMNIGRDGFENRSCHVDTGREDTRTAGYRPAEHDWRADYRAWLASLEPKHIGGGRYEVAA